MTNELEADLPERLRPLAKDVARLWGQRKYLECIDTCLLLGQALDDVITEAVAEARSEGSPWELIGQHLGATRQAVWQRFAHLDNVNSRKENEKNMNAPQIATGRQAYFRDLSLTILQERMRTAVELSDLYGEVEDRAELQWIDGNPCRHNRNQFEWQHDLRWSLLQLKARGLVRQPGRGRYEAV